MKWQDKVSNTCFPTTSQNFWYEAIIIEHHTRYGPYIHRGHIHKAYIKSSVLLASSWIAKTSGEFFWHKYVLKRHLTAYVSCDRWQEDVQAVRYGTSPFIKKDQYEYRRLEDLHAKCHTWLQPTYCYTYNQAVKLLRASCDRLFKSKYSFASHIRLVHNLRIFIYNMHTFGRLLQTISQRINFNSLF